MGLNDYLNKSPAFLIMQIRWFKSVEVPAGEGCRTEGTALEAITADAA
jgi:hypothetical protein